jgi:hypothetical protein
MHMGIPICIRGSPYVYGVRTCDSSPYANGDRHMHTVIPLIFENPPYAYGDPRMHTAIPICIWRYNIHLFPVCKWGLPYAYLNPCLHTGIPHMQKCRRGRHDERQRDNEQAHRKRWWSDDGLGSLQVFVGLNVRDGPTGSIVQH